MMALPAAGATGAILFDLGWPVAAVAAAFAAGHLIALPGRAGGRHSLSPAVAVAAALSLADPLGILLCAGAIGLPAGWWLARLRYGERASEDLFAAAPAGLLAFSGTLAAGSAISDVLVPLSFRDEAHLVVLLASCGAWYLSAALAGAWWSHARRRIPGRFLLRTALGDGSPYLVLFASGGLYGVAVGEMGVWAVPLAAIPYAFSHLSLQRLAATARTYRQTIRALGRVPEAGGYSQPGHAERTADLAAAVAGELRLPPAEVSRVEYAALLSDIGRVVLSDPAVAAGGCTTGDFAQWSEAIIGEVSYLERVAHIVGQMHLPYRRQGEERDPEVLASAQIVKIASSYDTHASGGMEPLDALEILHRGAAYEYDPDVVAALRRVLQRRRVPGV
jgi:hypothetical protein